MERNDLLEKDSENIAEIEIDTVEKLKEVSNKIDEINAVVERFGIDNIELISSLKKIKAEPTLENLLFLSRISDYGKLYSDKFMEETTPEKFAQIKELLELDGKNISELKANSILSITKDMWKFNDGGLKSQIKLINYYLNQYPSGDKELFDIFDKYSHRLNNDNPYQGWNNTSNYIVNLWTIKESFKKFDLDINSKDREVFKKIGNILGLISSNIDVTESNIQIIKTMGEYNGNYNLYVDIISKYFPVLKYFKSIVKRDVVLKDFQLILKEIYKQDEKMNSSEYGNPTVHLDLMNFGNCIDSLEEKKKLQEEGVISKPIIDKIYDSNNIFTRLFKK